MAPLDTLRGPAKARGFDVSEYEVALQGMRSSTAPVRVVQLSDLHVGNGHNADLLQSAVRAVGDLDPDMVALTGDYVDHRLSEIEPAAEMLGELHAPLGVWAALGNHDYYADGPKVASALEARGIHVLLNRSEEVAPGLWIAGTDDVLRGRPDVGMALRGIPAEDAVVLLSHHPEGFGRGDAPRVMLVLSGHTHGGQFSFRFFPAWLVCRIHLHTKRVAGWYERGPGRQYISRGLGVAGPFPFDRRINCQPEVAVFSLVSPG